MATPVPAEVPSEPVVDLTDQLPGDAYDAEPVATVQPLRGLSFSEEDLKGGLPKPFMVNVPLSYILEVIFRGECRRGAVH